MSGLRFRGNKEAVHEEAPSRPRISFESFDLYQKVAQADDQVRTTSGATVSLISIVICVLLVASELWDFLVPKQMEHMSVDGIVKDMVRINLDITFHALPCGEVNIDAMDVTGEQQNGLEHDISKMRLSPEGKQIGDAFALKLAEPQEAAPSPLPADYCGSCYGAGQTENQCCNTCDDVKTAYGERGWDVNGVTQTAEQCIREHKDGKSSLGKPGEGCRITGFLDVNKVAGNVHVAVGTTFSRGTGHIHHFDPQKMHLFNVSHTIHALSFGERFPGIRNPLDGVSRLIAPPEEGGSTAMVTYYIKVIPTLYLPQGAAAQDSMEYRELQGGSGAAAGALEETVAGAAPGTARSSGARDGKKLVMKNGAVRTNQYSITSSFRPLQAHGQRFAVLPGVYFVYEFSPFSMTVTAHSTSFTHLCTSVFAILGGVLSLAGIINAAIQWVNKTVKAQTGEQPLQLLLRLVTEGSLSGNAGGVKGLGSVTSSSSFAAFSGTSMGSSSGGGSGASSGAGMRTGVGAVPLASSSGGRPLAASAVFGAQHSSSHSGSSTSVGSSTTSPMAAGMQQQFSGADLQQQQQQQEQGFQQQQHFSQQQQASGGLL